MAEFNHMLTAAPILGGVDRDLGPNRILERSDLALVSLAIPLGQEEALAAALNRGLGLALPEPRQSRRAGAITAIRSTPDQLLFLLAHPTPDAEASLRGKLGDIGYTTDQTGAWIVLEISGPETYAALERLCPLDLAPQAFPAGAAARTVMEHMGAMVLCLEPGRFLLLSASSSAASFLHAVETSFRYVSTAPG